MSARNLVVVFSELWLWHHNDQIKVNKGLVVLCNIKDVPHRYELSYIRHLDRLMMMVVVGHARHHQARIFLLVHSRQLVEKRNGRP
jgi:hypothetical protein